jgi:hypothetical protein
MSGYRKGLRKLREMVVDRKKWKDIVQQTKADSWLQCQWKKEKFIFRPVHKNYPTNAN